ncbi:hypothetical protein, partial [Enterobacter hormaechei]|uniref:hypothetical protein n=1 Tax=Enterobacter hormaechei TaxID=158836 RepID=UPI001EDB1DC3
WLMMSLWDALRMNMMISYQELVRTFPKCKNNCCTLCAICGKGKSRVLSRDLNATIKLAINVKTGHL